MTPKQFKEQLLNTIDVLESLKELDCVKEIITVYNNTLATQHIELTIAILKTHIILIEDVIIQYLFKLPDAPKEVIESTPNLLKNILIMFGVYYDRNIIPLTSLINEFKILQPPKPDVNVEE